MHRGKIKPCIVQDIASRLPNLPQDRRSGLKGKIPRVNLLDKREEVC